MALAVSLALGACGSSSSSSSSPSSSSSASSSPTSSATSASSSSATGGSAKGGKAPLQLLHASAAALGNAHGYRMQGTIIEHGQQLKVSLATTGTSSVKLDFSTAGAAVHLITLPSSAYIRANSVFWTSHGGPRAAKLLADRWIRVPVANGQSLTSSLGPLAPSTLPRCLVENHGSLSRAGQTSVNGQSAILIKDAGNAPGAGPSAYAIAASGTPYPLRYTATGNERAGGRIDVCNTGKASSARGTLTFSEFGHVPAIKAPAHAEQPKGGGLST